MLFSKNFEGDYFDVNDLTPFVKSIDASELDYAIEIIGNSSIDLFKGSKFADVYHCEPLSAAESKNFKLRASNNTASKNEIELKS